MKIDVVPLGAGQDVGRSCVLVTLGGKTIMFDCGIHMGYNDERRYVQMCFARSSCESRLGFAPEVARQAMLFPDFKYISRTGNYTQRFDCKQQAIDAVIVTHFHLDHCGSLPYFTEVHGYHGPVIMTYPTKALIPLMLEDFRKVLVDRLGDHEYYTSAQIKQCMRK
eukprot:5947408-Pyramimonas_sp.AAC.1